MENWWATRLAAEEPVGEVLGIPLRSIGVANDSHGDKAATTDSLHLNHVQPSRARVVAPVHGVRVHHIVARNKSGPHLRAHGTDGIGLPAWTSLD